MADNGSALLGGPEEISVDADGTWFYRGAEIIHRDIVQLFCRHLIRDDQGRYFIRWGGQSCAVRVTDTPLVVWGASVTRGAGGDESIVLHLSDETSEPMDPGSFYIGPRNVPYCRVREGALPARFSRKAYYQIAGMVDEDPDDGGFFLRIGARRFPIRQEPGGP
jgi:hypothetical protein